MLTMDKMTIKDYLEELALHLTVLPKKDRDAQVSEIKDHLLQAAQEGASEHEVLMNFLPPKELAKDILAEYEGLYNFSKENGMNMTKHKPRSSKKLRIAIVSTFLVAIFVYYILPVILYSKYTEVEVIELDEQDGEITYERNDE